MKMRAFGLFYRRISYPFASADRIALTDGLTQEIKSRVRALAMIQIRFGLLDTRTDDPFMIK